ncbi:anti-sigma factor family protein [Dactylosporangium sp. NPDC051541]|uniref:anti-sigma factor family protein n=1 Tax=Dactylosporangium sp. NPDC051541 TaxID=3363977 RepID=UPI0037B1991B
MRCEHLHDSAVYVLGALSPPEREAYERHLADCAQCRAEVAEFSDLPGLLGRLDPEIAAQIALASDDDLDADGPPFLADAPAGRTAGGAPAATGTRWAGPTVTPDDGPTVSPTDSRWAGPTAVPAPAASRVNGSPVDPLLPRVLDRAQNARRTARRRRRWQTAGTALVAAFLGVIAVVGIRAAGVGQPDWEAMREVASAVPVSASLALSDDSGGTEVRMKCGYKAGENGAEYSKWTYTLVVVPKTGQPQEISTWSARPGDQMELSAHSDIPESNIARVEIRKGDGTPLLTLAT